MQITIFTFHNIENKTFCYHLIWQDWHETFSLIDFKEYTDIVAPKYIYDFL